jgi:hypothetical protein
VGLSPYRESLPDLRSAGARLGVLYRAHRPLSEEGPLEWVKRLRQYADPDVDRVLCFIIRCHEEVDASHL